MITAQILLTLDFMNQKGLIHRDLKPENILMSERVESKVYDIRIADFGFATAVEKKGAVNNQHLFDKDGDEKLVCGTVGYIAPETLDNKGYTIKSDIFSVGSIVFSMLTLRNLFPGSDQKMLMRLNKVCAFERLNERMSIARCSKYSCNFVKLLLQRDPFKRPTAAQALTLPWFNDDQIPLQSSLHLNKVMASGKWAELLKEIDEENDSHQKDQAKLQ
jgi:calcium/calmodulin-dependent protein kinase I